MLTSLDFLEVGNQFPPSCELERLEMYEKNRDIFEGKHAEVYEEDLKRIERVIGNFDQVISYPVVLNFQKIMTLKMADLLLGEHPIISAGQTEDGEKSKEQMALDTIIKNCDLYNTLYEGAIDVQRYGDGLLYVWNNGNNGKITAAQPSTWFPVVNPYNVKDITNHVLARVETVTEGNTKKTYLYADVHYAGYYERRLYLMNGNKIQRLLETEIVKTGMTGFAVVQMPNIMTSDRATGMDDYTDVDSIIAELMVRVGQISRILDKHASPSVQGPATALEQDPITGQWRLKMGNYFPRYSTDDPPVEYVVWDAQLSANFTQIEKLTNLLYTISEMGSALFGDLTGSTGQVPSGSALKRLMISPLAKVNRIRMRVDPAIKTALVLCSELGGKNIIDLNDYTIGITWQDGLPADPMEEAQIIEKRTGGKSTMSVTRVLTKYDGMESEDAAAEYEAILEDESNNAPTALPTFAQN